MYIDPINLSHATFVSRPHRFAVTCGLAGEEITAHLANPGRLSETLLPDTPLWISRSDDLKRKLRWSVVGAERNGHPVLLDTHLTNRIAGDLINSDRIPGLEGARVVGREVKQGHSRFDLVIQHGSTQRWVEVKSCTLFGNRIAAFPDAVTERGRKHLNELALLASPGNQPIVLFIVHTSHVDLFRPDYHTDLAFSQSFLDHRDHLEIVPVSIEWNDRFQIVGIPRRLEIPWQYLEGEVADQGAYILLLHLASAKEVLVGRLGEWTAVPGWYVYVGSAMRTLSHRINRHLRRRKKMHWHIDYLRAAADKVIAYPIRSSRREECDIAARMSELLSSGPAGFGSSDCDCASHLYHSPTDPRTNPAFHEALHHFRFRHPVD